MREFLKSLGVHLRQDWIAHCLGQRNALDGPQEAKEAIYGIFLSCDLREAGEACLPSGVGNLAKERIRNKVVVQVCTVHCPSGSRKRNRFGVTVPSYLRRIFFILDSLRKSKLRERM